MQDRLQRLALAQRARTVVGQPYGVAVVGDRRFAGQHFAHDRRVVAQLGDRRAPGGTVPALHHLRSRHSKADDGAPAPGERVDGHGVHGGGGGAAGVDLNDGGAETDPAGVRGQVRQRRQRVGAVGLGRPHAVVAEPLRELHRCDRHLQPRAPVQVQPDPQLHDRCRTPPTTGATLVVATIGRCEGAALLARGGTLRGCGSGVAAASGRRRGLGADQAGQRRPAQASRRRLAARLSPPGRDLRLGPGHDRRALGTVLRRVRVVPVRAGPRDRRRHRRRPPGDRRAGAGPRSPRLRLALPGGRARRRQRLPAPDLRPSQTGPANRFLRLHRRVDGRRSWWPTTRSSTTYPTG